MNKKVSYGIICSCIGIALGFAVGFPVINQLPYEKRGYIGVPLMLVICIGLGVLGAAIGINIGSRGNAENEE